MLCEQPTVAEKLVPYVEGALAEPDRSEVLAHLRSCAACQAEVRLLKDSIVSLRKAFVHATAYRPGGHASCEELERFAFEPESLEADVARRLKLHLAECADCSEEVSMLREMEQELAEKVDPVRAPDALPNLLREAIARQFGEPASERRQAARPWLETLTAMLAGLNPRPVMAALGAVAVLVVGMQFVQQKPNATSTSQVAVSDGFGATPAAPAGGLAIAPPRKQEAVAPMAPARAGKAAPKKEAQVAGQVALLPNRVDPQDLPKFSRHLWEKKVSHTYKDGQIFVAAEDIDKARAALEMEPREVAAVDVKTKTSTVSTPTPPALDDLSKNSRVTAALSQAGVQTPELQGHVGGPPQRQAPPKMHLILPGRDREVAASDAVTAPAHPPETQRNDETKGRATHAAAPGGGETRTAPAATPRRLRPLAAPTAARREVASADKPSAYESVPVLVPKDSKAQQEERPAPPRQQVAHPPTQVAVSMPAETAAGSNMSGGANEVAVPARPAAAPQPAAVSQPPAHLERTAPPAPAAAGATAPRAVEKPALAPPPAAKAANTGQVAMAAANRGAAPATNVPSGAGRAPAVHADEGGDSVALTGSARRIAHDTVGESTVAVETREDGGRVVTVRPARALSSLEVDRLRKALRQGLGLGDLDTVVIRQP